MYIFRALNSMDKKINPKDNGLIAKSIINQVLDSQYQLSIDMMVYNQEIDDENTAKSKEMYHEVRNKLIYEYNIAEILHLAVCENERIKKIIEEVKTTGNINLISVIVDILATKNPHLTDGSRNDYGWISFSRDLGIAVRTYCREESTIAVIESDINGYLDNNLIAFDLSSKAKIRENNKILLNTNKTQTKENYRGNNNAIKSKEVIYYNMVPKEKIVTTLNALEYELMLLGFLEEEYCKYSEEVKNTFRKEILSYIRELFKDGTDLDKYIINGYFDKNVSLTNLENKVYCHDTIVCENKAILDRIKNDSSLKRKVLILKQKGNR